MTRPFFGFLFMALTALPLWAADEKPKPANTLLVKAQKAYPVNGDPIAPAFILIKDGKIEAISKEAITPPEGTPTLDAPVVIPGIVDAASYIGLRTPIDEQSDEITPDVQVADCFDPSHPDIAQALAQGITTAHVLPGSYNVVAGLSALVKTFGPENSRRILQKRFALKAVMSAEATAGNSSWGYGAPRDIFFRRPTTRMAVTQALNKAFDQAQDALNQKNSLQQDMNVLTSVLSGKRPLVIRAGDVVDLRIVLKQAEAYQFKPLIEGGWEAFKTADALGKAGLPVLLGPMDLGLRSQAGNATEFCLNNAGILAARGIPIAITTSDTDIAPLFMAAMAVRHGLSEHDALKALTLGPATILQIEKQYGSLAPGKQANLVLLSRTPFTAEARIIKVIGEGKIVFPKGEGRK